MRSVAGLALLTSVGLLVGAVALGQSRSAQGTDFNFQGRLTVDGSPATGAFDLQFELFADPSGGSPLGSVVLLDDVTVTDGLFTAVLDFGSQFEGSTRYVQTSVRAGADTGAYTPISPRQALRGSPYALYALSIPLAGSGTASTAAHSDHEHDAVYWKQAGNAGTSAGSSFLGTTDAQALELKVNGARALRLEPDATSPNLIGGFSQNSVSAGVKGSTIGGGGNSQFTNRVTDDYGTVGGGYSNLAGDNAGTTADHASATVGGGTFNSASGLDATVGGGSSNTARGPGATVGGGISNLVNGLDATAGGGLLNTVSGELATVGGGWFNTASGKLATVDGGTHNTALGMLATVGGGGSDTAGQGNRATDDYGTVGGGFDNQAGDNLGTAADRPYTTVGGGNSNSAISSGATVAGGGKNIAGFKIISVAGRAVENGQYASVGGGFTNTAHGSFATIGGGQLNSAEDNATVGGGNGNRANGLDATVGGGNSNTASGGDATVGGGNSNTASGTSATVGGGQQNAASDFRATVGGGLLNTASGSAATVGGGAGNAATGLSATVGGGGSNTAINSDATVGGGAFNTASGISATVPGGDSNVAGGNYSLAAGRRAKANHAGSFVWADAQNADFPSNADNQFSIRAAGGVRLASDAGAAKAVGVGELYRDNAVVAWAKVAANGTLSTDFGVVSVSRVSAGNYAITLNASAVSDTNLVPVANAEIDGPPSGASAIRSVSIDQTGVNTFSVYINNGTFALVDNDFVFLVTAR